GSTFDNRTDRKTYLREFPGRSHDGSLLTPTGMAVMPEPRGRHVPWSCRGEEPNHAHGRSPVPSWIGSMVRHATADRMTVGRGSGQPTTRLFPVEGLAFAWMTADLVHGRRVEQAPVDHDLGHGLGVADIVER